MILRFIIWNTGWEFNEGVLVDLNWKYMDMQQQKDSYNDRLDSVMNTILNKTLILGDDKVNVIYLQQVRCCKEEAITKLLKDTFSVQKTQYTKDSYNLCYIRHGISSKKIPIERNMRSVDLGGGIGFLHTRIDKFCTLV